MLKRLNQVSTAHNICIHEASKVVAIVGNTNGHLSIYSFEGFGKCRPQNIMTTSLTKLLPCTQYYFLSDQLTVSTASVLTHGPLSPMGIRPCLERFCLSQLVTATDIYQVEAMDATKHPTMNKSVLTTKDCLSTRQWCHGSESPQRAKLAGFKSWLYPKYQCGFGHLP